MMRLFVLAVLAVASPLVPAHAQTQAPAQPLVLHARTGGELAELCAAKPTDAASAARLNFCFGYAQATLDAAARQAGGKRSYCIPSPSPSRQATMAEFAGWVRSTPAAAGANSQEALMRFMGQRFPCKT
jgi:hypothetical protein